MDPFDEIILKKIGVEGESKLADRLHVFLQENSAEMEIPSNLCAAGLWNILTFSLIAQAKESKENMLLKSWMITKILPLVNEDND